MLKAIREFKVQGKAAPCGIGMVCPVESSVGRGVKGSIHLLQRELIRYTVQRYIGGQYGDIVLPGNDFKRTWVICSTGKGKNPPIIIKLSGMWCRQRCQWLEYC